MESICYCRRRCVPAAAEAKRDPALTAIFEQGRSFQRLLDPCLITSAIIKDVSS